jgi:hypothetical protein
MMHGQQNIKGFYVFFSLITIIYARRLLNKYNIMSVKWHSRDVYQVSWHNEGKLCNSLGREAC